MFLCFLLRFPLFPSTFLLLLPLWPPRPSRRNISPTAFVVAAVCGGPHFLLPLTMPHSCTWSAARKWERVIDTIDSHMRKGFLLQIFLCFSLLKHWFTMYPLLLSLSPPLQTLWFLVYRMGQEDARQLSLDAAAAFVSPLGLGDLLKPRHFKICLLVTVLRASTTFKQRCRSWRLFVPTFHVVDFKSTEYGLGPSNTFHPWGIVQLL